MVEDQPYQCPKCGELFSKREGYQRKKHLLEQHQLELFWRCTQCSYRTVSRRYHDHAKHWRARHFGEQEPPKAELMAVEAAGSRDTRRVLPRRRSTSRTPPRPSTSRSRTPVRTPPERRRQTRSRGEEGSRGRQPRRGRGAERRRAPTSSSRPTSSSSGGERRSRDPRGSSAKSPPAAAARAAAEEEVAPASTSPPDDGVVVVAVAPTAPESSTSEAPQASTSAAPESAERAAPTTPEPVSTTAAETLSAAEDARRVVTSVAAFPEPEVLEEETVELHTSYADLDNEEDFEVVQPEAPVTLAQVRTWLRYQATPQELRLVQDELGEDRRSRIRTHNRRIQADFRPLVRDCATQVQVRPRVTRLPAGGLSVEGADFTFRCDQAVEGQLALQD